jgi:predicted ATP-grasp superfamily ATP-dependent carboligase
MKILITGVGGVTPRSFAQALRKYSKYAFYELIGTDSNKYALGLYMPELFNKTYLVPKVSDPDYWTVIDSIIDNERIDIAVINPELEVVEWARRSISHKFPLKVLLPHYELASRLVDKAILSEALEPHGLVPRSFTLDKESLKESNKLKLDYPFWIRSALGSSGLGAMKINSFDELRNWTNVNPKVEKFLASEFLPGRNLGCKMLYHNGELLRSAIAERVYYIMAKVAPSGITGNTCFGRLVNSPEAFRVASKAMDIMFEKTQTPKHGFYTVDLKEASDGTPMVTEVNVRFVAFAQCYAAGGANLPEDLIRVVDGDISFNREFKLYEFDPDLIFLRDVDEQPVIMRESQLLNQYVK